MNAIKKRAIDGIVATMRAARARELNALRGCCAELREAVDDIEVQAPHGGIVMLNGEMRV